MYKKNKTLSSKLFEGWNFAVVSKLKIVMLLFGAFFASSLYAFGQTISINAKNKSLKSVLLDVTREVGYHFIYDNNLLDDQQKVSLVVEKNSLDAFLGILRRDYNIRSRVNNKNVALFPNKGNLPAQQEKTIKGKVLDDKGNALAGATIRQKGTSKQTVADAKGDFSLVLESGSNTIQISSVGYQLEEVAVGTESTIVVRLKLKVETILDVVTIGYGEVHKKDLTGAVATVNLAALENTPVTRIDQMLQGRIAGADFVSTSGEPGEGTSVRIRGTRSINADNEPLYVVDGIIDAGSLSSINPSDIESVQVLKDASSTAIYGSRGANGVIIINTRKGGIGKDVFTYNSELGYAHLPKFLDVMNAREYATMVNENAWFNNPATTSYPYPDAENMGEGTNWTKEVVQVAPYINQGLSASGGSSGLRYFASGNYANQEGIIKNSGFVRYQGRLNVDRQFSSKFRGGVRLNYSSNTTNMNKVDIGSHAGWWNSTLALPPVMNVYDQGDDNTGEGDIEFEDWNPGWYAGGVINTPVALVELMKFNSYRKNLWMNAFLEYDILSNLKIKSTFSNTNYFRNDSRYEPGALPRRKFLEQGGYAVKQAYTYEKILSETTISYNKSWNSIHRFNALGGFTAETTKGVNQWQRGYGYLIDAVEDNNMQAADKDLTAITSNLTSTSMASFLARFNYDYKRKYYLTFTGRADGSSNFSASHKWAFFPSAAFKWNMLQESFMRGLQNSLGEAGLRVSYGASGNQGISPYGSLPKLTSSSNGYIIGGTPSLTYYPSNIPNDNLSWETSDQVNIGLDLKSANERVSLTVDLYRTITKDLLLTIQLPEQVGFPSRLVNLGKTMNQGVEVALNTTNLQTLGGFKWTSAFTFAHNQNKVLDLGNLVRVTTEENYAAPQYYMYAYEVGKPISGLYGVRYAGTWKSQEEIDQWGGTQYVSIPSYYSLGRQRYIDQNGDGALSEADEVFLGQTEPKFYGGLGNNFTWKGIELDVFFQYSLGAKIYNPTEFKMGTGYVGPNQYRYMLNRWHPTNNPNSDIPRVNSQDFVATDRFVHDASYLRLGTARLGYTFSEAQLRSMKIFKSLGVFATGTNLWLWTKYNGYDPDVSNASSSTVRRKDDGVYPKNRTFAVSITAKF